MSDMVGTPEDRFSRVAAQITFDTKIKASTFFLLKINGQIKQN